MYDNLALEAAGDLGNSFPAVIVAEFRLQSTRERMGGEEMEAVSPGLELISFSQLVCQCRQGLCYLMPYRYHLKATSKVSPSTKTPPVCCGQVAPTYQLPLLI